MKAENGFEELTKTAGELMNKAKDGELALYKRAASKWKEAVVIAEEVYGDTDKTTLDLRENWASSLMSAKDVTEAITCNHQNVEKTREYMKESESKGDDRLLLDARARHVGAQRRLAESYLANKQYEEAIGIYEVVVNVKPRMSLEDTYKARIDLAAALFQSGTDRNIMRAVNLNLETVQSAERNLGQSHIETVKARYNLGIELYKLKKYDDVSLRLNELLEILQAEHSKASLTSEEHRGYLEDTKASLKTCSAKIAHRIEKANQALLEAEEKRRNEVLNKQIAERMQIEETTRQQKRQDEETAAKTKQKHENEQAQKTNRKLERKSQDQERQIKARKERRIRKANNGENKFNEGEEPQSKKMSAKPHSTSTTSGPHVESTRISTATATEPARQTIVVCPTITLETTSESRLRPRSASDACGRPSSLTEGSHIPMQRLKSTRSTPAGDQLSAKPITANSSAKNGKSRGIADGKLVEISLTPEKLATGVENDVKNKASNKRRKQNQSHQLSTGEAQLKSGEEQTKSESIVDTPVGITKESKPWNKEHGKTRLEPLKPVTNSESTYGKRPNSALAIGSPNETGGASRRLSVPSMALSEAGPLNEVVEEWKRAAKESGSEQKSSGKMQESDQTTEPKTSFEESVTMPTESVSVEEPRALPKPLTRLEVFGPTSVEEVFHDRSRNFSDTPVQEEPAILVESTTSDSPTNLQDTSTATLRKRSNSQQMIDTEETSAGNTAPEIKIAADTQPPIATLPEPVRIVRKGTFDSSTLEWSIPGSWHGEFDEPIIKPRLRRARSIDRKAEGSLRVSEGRGPDHKRASSVGLFRFGPPAMDFSSMQNWSTQDEIIADNWFEALRSDAHKSLDKYEKDSNGKSRAERPVKIAVLDTGVAKVSTKGPAPLMRGPRIKLGKQLDRSLPWNVDTNGHGTHAAGLLLTVCPYADVYVYRVCEGNGPIDRGLVADAMTDAIDKKKVDIISMSLGWQENSHPGLQAAIKHANASNVLLFAASSNEGIRTKAGMAYPARAKEVIAIDAADVHGSPSKFNPPQNRDKTRFTALGEAVRSTYPIQLPSEDPEPGWKRMFGTSCATPIAAGIAGLVLEFARQRPLCYETDVETYLKTIEGVGLILTKCFSYKLADSSTYNHLDPNMLFHCKDTNNDGGGWSAHGLPRLRAADKIIDVLKEEFSQDIGRKMTSELQKDWARGGS